MVKKIALFVCIATLAHASHLHNFFNKADISPIIKNFPELNIITPMHTIQYIIVNYLTTSDALHDAYLHCLIQTVDQNFNNFELIQKIDSLLSADQKTELRWKLMIKNKALIEKHIPHGFTSVALGASINKSSFLDQTIVHAIAVNQKYGLIAIAAQDNANTILELMQTDAQKKMIFNEYYRFSSIIHSLAITPDGKYVLMGDHGGRICRKNRDVLNGRGSYLKCADKHLVTKISVSSNSMYAVACLQDKYAYVINLIHPRELQLYAKLSHNTDVTSAAFTHDSRSCIAGCVDGTFTIWDLVGQKPKKIVHVKAHTNALTALTISSQARIMITGSADGEAIVWTIHDLTKPQKLAHLYGHTKEITNASFSHDNIHALTVSRDGTMRLWNFEDVSQPACMRLFSDGYYAMWNADFGPDKNNVLAHPESKAHLFTTSVSFIGRDLQLVPLMYLITLLKNGVFNENKVEHKELISVFPTNLQRYLRKLHEVRKKFGYDITDIILAYLGSGLTYEYQQASAPALGEFEAASQPCCVIS